MRQLHLTECETCGLATSNPIETPSDWIVCEKCAGEMEAQALLASKGD